MKKTEACPVFKISHNSINNRAFRHNPETFKKIRIVPDTTLVFREYLTFAAKLEIGVLRQEAEEVFLEKLRYSGFLR
ncbi:hypothetical protein QUA62_05790 [Microcoleus sp. MON1_C1]|uniref:hypothetical protein n=1 Tax=Microcoleus sp. MON1_C1 TaxID=2818827 RepID=UPI002FD5B27C